MKNILLKQKIALILSIIFTMSAIAIPVTAKKAPLEERSINSKAVVTFSKTQVWGEDTVDVTVRFRDTMNRKVPISLHATRDATILVANNSDIKFETNGKQVPIDSFTRVDDSTINVLTGTVTRNKFSTLTFRVQAPMEAASLQIVVGTDALATEWKTVTSAPLKILSGLTIENPTEGQFLNDIDPVNIWGYATVRGNEAPANSSVFLEIVSPDESVWMEEIQLKYNLQTGEKQYAFDDVILPSDFPDGEYLMRAYLIDQDDDDKIIGYAERRFQYKNRPDVLQVSIYAQQRGIYVTKNDPTPGEGVFYPKLYVYPHIGWYVPDDPNHGNHNIQSKVQMKNTAEIANATNVYFEVINTSFDIQTYPAQKSTVGAKTIEFFGNLRPLRTKQGYTDTDGVRREPTVRLRYTDANGVDQMVFVGTLEPILDPSGYVYDKDTGDKDTGKRIEGATVTLYRQDDDTGEWIKWVDQTGTQENPQTTDKFGKFRWDVEDGEYEVRIFHPDYHPKGEFYSTLFDPEHGQISVPPERDDVFIGISKMVIPPNDDEEKEPETEPNDTQDPNTEPQPEQDVITNTVNDVAENTLETKAAPSDTEQSNSTSTNAIAGIEELAQNAFVQNPIDSATEPLK